MDFVLRLTDYDGFDVIWVVLDRLSKMQYFIPCHTAMDAVGLARLFRRDIICLHGLPVWIVSGHRPEFTSSFWRQICILLGIDL
jgi:hypothetical protein